MATLHEIESATVSVSVEDVLPASEGLRPEHIDEKHWNEWRRCVSESITSRNVKSIHDSRELDRILNRNAKRRTKHSDNLVPCWVVTGLDPLGWERTLDGAQAKPDVAPIDENGKSQKYFGASGYTSAPLYLETEENDYWLRVYKDVSIPFNITEGAKKAGAGLSHKHATASIPGVTTCRKHGKLHEKLAIFIKPGRTVRLIFDNDVMTKKPVQNALWNLGRELAAKGAKVMVVIIPPGEAKGMDDFIAAHGIEEFNKLIDEALTIEEWRERLQAAYEREKIATDEDRPKSEAEGGASQRIPKADIIAAEIAKDYEGKFIWNNEHKSWMIYEHKHSGIWSAVDDHFIQTQIQNLLTARGVVGYGSDSYITNICKFLSRILVTFEWEERLGVLPFEDGVALIGSNGFEEHSPDNRLTWCLPRRYFTPAISDWGTIRDWMAEAWSDENDREILLHFMAAVLNRRHDLQKFLYLVGTGGAGKGTYTRLLQAVIGSRNVWAGKVESLSNPNETFRLVNKPLAVFSDQDKVTSGLQLFKNLTGGDTMSAKQLYKDGFNFNFEGLALMTANAPALMGAGSWMKRRAIVIRCTHQAAVERNLDAEFASEIAAFTKYLLSISNADIDRVLRDTRPTSGAVDLGTWETLLQTDSIAAWIEECVTFDPMATTAIGSNKDEVIEDPTLATLFGSYHKFCRGAGLQGKSKSNFSPELEEMAQKVLGKKFVTRHRTKTGRVMIGVRLRSHGDPYYSDSLIPGDDLVTTGDDLVTTGDDRDDDRGDDLKPLLHKEGDEGDDQTKEKLDDKSHSSKSENKSSPSQNTQTIEESRHHIVTADQNADTVIVSENEQVVTTSSPASSPASSPTKPQILIGCDVPLVVGKKVKCYPTATHAERRYSVTATIISVEVGGDYFAGCTIKYWDKKSEQYQTGRIGGGSGNWILSSV